MSELGFLEIEYVVRGFDCGYGGPFSPLALANFFQEAAGAHAERLGFGMSDLAAAGQTWMLSRLDLRIDGLPREGDRVRVRTWPSGCERLFALRDLVLESTDGRSLARAVYAYLVVDVAARKPLRPERAFPDLARLGVAEHAIGDFRLGASAIAGAEAVCELGARPRHIDHNGHVNNAHIVNWLVDAAAGRLPWPARGLRVDFLQEVLSGELLEAVVGEPAGAGAGAPAGRQAGAASIDSPPGLGGGPLARSVVTELRRGGVACARAELSA